MPGPAVAGVTSAASAVYANQAILAPLPRNSRNVGSAAPNIAEVGGTGFTTGNLTAVTTSAFTPAPNCLMVAYCAQGNGAAGTAGVGTVTDSVGGTWTRLIGFGDNLGVAEIWVKDSGPTPASQSVTYDPAGTGASGTAVMVKWYSGARAAGQQNGPTVTTNTAAYTATLTTIAPGSFIAGAFARAQNAATVVASDGTTILGQFSGSAGDTAALFRTTNATGQTGPTTVGFTNTASGVQHLAAVEILPASYTAAAGAPEADNPAGTGSAPAATVDVAAGSDMAAAAGQAFDPAAAATIDAPDIPAPGTAGDAGPAGAALPDTTTAAGDAPAAGVVTATTVAVFPDVATGGGAAPDVSTAATVLPAVSSGAGTTDPATNDLAALLTAPTGSGSADPAAVATESRTDAAPGTATSTGSADPATPTGSAGAETPAAAGLAFPAATATQPGAGTAAADTTAPAPNPALTAAPAAADGTTTAAPATTDATTGPEFAEAAGSADQAVINSSSTTNVPAAYADSPGDAYDPAVMVTAPADPAVAAGAAPGAAVASVAQATPTAETAAAIGSAGQPAVAAVAAPTASGATGQAYNAGTAVTGETGAAAAAGAADPASYTGYGTSDTAYGAGTAADAAALAVIASYAPAETADSMGAGQPPTITVVFTAPPSVAVGSAHDSAAPVDVIVALPDAAGEAENPSTGFAVNTNAPDADGYGTAYPAQASYDARTVTAGITTITGDLAGALARQTGDPRIAEHTGDFTTAAITGDRVPAGVG